MSYDDDRHWIVFGYPGIMHRDFFLPWLRNMQAQGYLTEADWNQFRSWQVAVMQKDALGPFYLRVQKLREPLWKEVHRQWAERKRKTQQPASPPKEPRKDGDLK